jgi:hypothetical protein
MHDSPNGRNANPTSSSWIGAAGHLADVVISDSGDWCK